LPNHENENELFLIGKKLTYKMLLHIINTNIKAFNNNVEYLRVENETLRQIIASSNQTQEEYNYNTMIQELLKNQKEMFATIQRLEISNQKIVEKLNSSQTKTTTNFNQPLTTLGPRLQKINPENRVLIIDAGTFMTADIIESKGFMGGYIFPGSKTFLQSYSLGKQLPVIKKIESNEALPHSTEEAISMAHEIYLDSVLKELMNKHSPKKVIITGGDGEKILLKMKKISSTIPLEFDPHLLHFAIHSIYQNHLKDQ
jgi:pantothenate kinase type III